MTAAPDDTPGDGAPEDGAPGGGAPSEGRRAGFVALVGVPNAGKSTLLNALVGAKVAIVSRKPQTTRTRVLGITIEGASQLVFVDTPGIFEPRRRLDRAMVRAAWQGAEDADLVVLLADVSRRNVVAPVRPLIERLKQGGRPAMLALNKIDLVPRPRLLEIAAALNLEGAFTDTFMISALTGDGLADLRRTLAARVPEGPWLYPEDQISDMPLRLLAAEITREKLFERLHDELPYAVTVETEEWEERADGSVRVGQVIYIQRDSQKAIVLGRGGQMIKTIGQAARLDLEEAAERRVHLNLFVKVREDWIDDPERYRDWGLDYGA